MADLRAMLLALLCLTSLLAGCLGPSAGGPDGEQQRRGANGPPLVDPERHPAAGRAWTR